MNAFQLHGLVVAAHTPFHSDGSLNLTAVESQLAHYLKNNLTQVFIGGTTGESHSLTFAERGLLAERWMEAARGTPMQVVVHVGSNCLADAVALARQAEKLGAAAVSAMSPSFFQPRSTAALIECLASIASAAPATPFYYYDIPSMTRVLLPMPEFLASAPSRIPNLAGIKFTNPDLMSYLLCLNVEEGRWDIPWGIDEWLLGGLAVGARGAIGSTYNFAAPLYQRLWAAFERGDMAAARGEQLRSANLIRLLSGYGYMGAAKTVMKMLGVDIGPARQPNDNLSTEQAQNLRRELESMGFFDKIST